MSHLEGDALIVGVTPYWTGVEECDVYEGDVALPRNGSDEPVSSVARTHGLDGPCVEDSDFYEGTVALRRTGSDQTVNNVVSTVGPGGPGIRQDRWQTLSGM